MVAGGNERFLTGESQEAIHSHGGPTVMGPEAPTQVAFKCDQKRGAKEGAPQSLWQRAWHRWGRGPACWLRRATWEGHGGEDREKKRQRVTVGHWFPPQRRGMGGSWSWS